jgi:phage terminase large subunit-like protein
VNANATAVADFAMTRGYALKATRPYRTKAEISGVPWSELARPEQLPPPGDWRFWLLMAGRGFGKTRTGAEYVREEVQAGRAAEVMLIAATTSDVRDVVVEGPSGIVKVCERAGWRVRYEPSKQRITFPNGAVARTRSADEPDRIRGPECDLAWWDEFGTWKHRDAFTNADFGLRRMGPKGDRARAVVTFTPKRTALVRELVAHPQSEVVGGHTMDNAANLDPATVASLNAKYGGTNLGRQELGGELLQDVEGAHWNSAMIEAGRVTQIDVPALRRIVIGVDPQGQTGISSETGIVAAGVGRPEGADCDHGYVLADASGDFTPNGWATEVLDLYRSRRADRIVAEINFGGQMVESTIRTSDPDAPITMVSASRGKMVRAEPIAALYEQGRVHHVGGFPQLEDEMTGFDGTGPSPNRMDALVWALTDAMPIDDAPAVASSGVSQRSRWG